MKKIIIVMFLLLSTSACNILIKDDPKNGINYIPLEYSVESIDYIKDYQDNTISWRIKPLDSVDVNLEVLFPLTDRKNVEVVDLKLSQNNIILDIKSTFAKRTVLKKPLIKIILKGINPYKKDNYNLVVNSNFNFINPKLNYDLIKKVINKNHNNIFFEPSSVSLSKLTNKLSWNLIYPIVITNDVTPFESLRFTVDDETKKIENTSRYKISKKISKGIPLEYLDINNFLYIKDNTIYSYNIPKNESLNISNNKIIVDNFKRDYLKNKVYIYSKKDPGNLLVINSDLSTEKITIGKFDIIDFDVCGNNIVFCARENNKSNIYKNFDGKNFLVKSLVLDIKKISTNCNDIIIESKSDNEIIINRIDSNGNISYIGKGYNHKLNQNYIYYLKSNSNSKYSELISYSLYSGLKTSILHGLIYDINQSSINTITIKENVEGITQISTLRGNNLKRIILLPISEIFYSDINKVIILNHKNTLWSIDTSNLEDQ